ncbi:hypothetical protein QJ857_gp0449 [Tupanvirus soda lake]|uniref:Major capsid protein n=2 Tax=Tupanvirus TaxID=2094720 RepID=A0A6N1NNS8_9VIRU|nr:hypothetical protein QJ857_gp0449 [Tupanvirus soda lake]QKU35590.1 hypothetical protein [Tupanvirus soda lake]
MPFGTLQLIYIGEQNLYITENPQITFFKTVYKRHTNFAIDTVQEFFNGKINFGQQIKCKLSKNGDLLSKMGMYIKLSSLNETKQHIKCSKMKGCLCTCSKCLLNSETEEITYGWANAIGHVLLEWIEIYIGGQLIDRHYGEWLEIWTELTQTSEKRLGYYEMIGKKDPLAYTVDSFTEDMELYVPFNFWFCRNIGLALPVMCLIYHDVEFIIKIRDFDQCWVCNKSNAPKPKASIDACILADYIYLSMEERHKFYSETHIYLIEQLQLNDNNLCDSNTGNINIDLLFNHPVKELIWFVQRRDVLGPSDGVWPEDCSYPKGNDHFNFTTARIPRLSKLGETFSEARLQLSGTDRTANWPASYYRLWQNYYYHTRIPTANYLYTYSFGLSPEDHQPSGECNMSMVDNARLCLKLLNKLKTKEKYPVISKVYATNYQVLLITAGMGAPVFYN